MQAEKTRGDYRTRTGEAVRRLMEQTKGEHLTADDVRRLVSEEGISMGLSTVYRQLDRLVAEGAVQRISGDRVGSCYAKKTAGDSSHYHLVCHVCGNLSHVDCEKLGEVFSHVMGEHGFAIDPCRTVLYGTCRACQRAMKKGDTV